MEANRFWRGGRSRRRASHGSAKTVQQLASKFRNASGPTECCHRSTKCWELVENGEEDGRVTFRRASPFDVIRHYRLLSTTASATAAPAAAAEATATAAEATAAAFEAASASTVVSAVEASTVEASTVASTVDIAAVIATIEIPAVVAAIVTAVVISAIESPGAILHAGCAHGSAIDGAAALT